MTDGLPQRDLGKSQGRRVDFRIGEFDRTILEKGYRLLWSRGIFCPCRLNSQTDQPDPTCTVCGGDGWMYVHPDPKGMLLKLYEDDDPKFEGTPEAMAAQGIITSITRDPQIFENLGEWIFGTASLTTFTFMKVAYRDRFEHVDSTMIWNQILPMPSDGVFRPGTDIRQNLRYKAITLHNVITVDSSNNITEHLANATVNADGSITLVGTTPPATGIRVALVYEMHPIWIVVEHTYAVRDTLRAFKTPKLLGDVALLPQNQFIRLDFLVGPTSVVSDAP